MLTQDQFPWAAVAFGAGAALYFALPAEPAAAARAGLLLAGALALLAALRGPFLVRPFFWLLLLACAGVLSASWRTERVAAPVLEFRYYGPVEGRIVGRDVSRSGAPRLTLGEVVLADVPPGRTPARVRVALHGARPLTAGPGDRVMLTAHLSPPPAPAEPGGFDFRRHAYFRQIGAVGYSRTPVLLADPTPPTDLAAQVFALRMALSDRLRRAIPGQEGAFAAAILTGDRSGLDQSRVQDLRHANLAHLLAISGLHMALLTGAVFAFVRGVLAAIPPLAIRVQVRKPAALAALAAAVAYLLISGGSVATQRAFVMVALMLVGLCLDRRALSLRSVAWAALVVLVLWPESVSGPGFQMSFAATTALVAVWGVLRDRAELLRMPGALRWTLSIFVSSLVAGLATAPIAAAHFNIMAHYGLMANLAAVPVMGTIVMPGALVAMLGAPFGFAAPGLWALEQGIGWILLVADRVAHLPGAVGGVVRPPGAALPLILAGGILATLLSGRARWLGAVAVAAGLAIWPLAPRPPLLISESGALFGVMTPDGRSLSKPRGDGFAAAQWLENDGDLTPQAAAADRPGLQLAPLSVEVRLGPHLIRQVRGTNEARMAQACEGATLVVLTARPNRPPEGCEVYDAKALRRSGALAVWTEGPDLRLKGSREGADRPWTTGP